MSSIREVARLAGVSPATVSRVMNGTAKVDPEKREKVLRVIEQTGFVPNEVARSLFRKSAKLIGLIIPNLQNPYFAQLAASIDEAAAEHGYRVFLCETGRDAEKVKATLQMLMSMNADGVVLTVMDPELEAFLPHCTVPVAAVDCMEKPAHVAATIYCDYYRGGRLAAEHLLDRGCRKVICIRGDQAIFSARMRYQGYRDVCRERGIEEHTLSCDYNFSAGLAMTEELLQRYPDADGILACNDMVAISTFKVLHKNHISVPGQVRLVGFDDIHMTRLMTPELTTIHQPIEEMAQSAVRSLINEESRPEKAVVFPVSLMIRETT